ncbi:MAG TPA: D-glycero-beta-D-manno-heptose-7-phosphate kinase [Pyrinomonadaceae bacterium]|nr:D-glycero-beta-D-manno-heptose-7-phosphate kinase [Pyrinomonadaceae bacterium]HMP64927.1 D-glycero-beta-D-manno-heptose-7-phosphate kinase [Pyrinomonadaceae bacterium]
MIENLKSARLLIVGDVMLDRYWWGDVDRISPEAPVPVVRLRRSSVAAGGAGNVAVNAAGLGARTFLVGAVGNDEEASVVRRVLEKEGIDPADLVTRDGAPTTVKTRIVAHGQHVVRVDQESDAEDPAFALERETESALSHLDNVDAVIVSDYAKGFVSDVMLRELFSGASARNIPVLVDPKGRDYARFHGATLITPNLREAADAAGIDSRSRNVATAAGTRLMETGGFQAVLVTQGSDGMTLFRRDFDPTHMPAHAREVYDVTGAGDTVIATMGASVAAGFDLEEAARLANLAAGVVVAQIGTTSIKFDELSSALMDAGISVRKKAS